MKLLSSLLSITLVLFSFTIISCEDENATHESDLLGTWNITAAIRDSKPTTTMDGMYFKFEEGGTLTTNMSGEPESYQFEVADEQIAQRGGTIDADYKIESRLENELVLTTAFGGKPFKITLARDINE